MDILTKQRMKAWANEFGVTPEYGFPSKDQDLFEYYVAFVYTNEHLKGNVKHLSDMVVAGQEWGVDAIGIFVNGSLLTDPGELGGLLHEGDDNKLEAAFLQAKTSPKYKNNMVARFINQVKYIGEAASNPDESDLPGLLHLAAKNLEAIIQNINRFDSPQIPCRLRFVTTAAHDNTAESLKDPHVSHALKDLTNLGLFQPSRQKNDPAQSEHSYAVNFRAEGKNELWQRYRLTTSPQQTSFKWDRRQTIPAATEGEEAMIGVITAEQLLRIVSSDGDLRPNILDDNVRRYQGEDNPVNRDIGSTLRSDRRRQFPYLNNGLTITTNQLSIIGDNVSLTNYQVVNGGQTSREILNWAQSLGSNESQLLCETWVPIKVIKSNSRDTLRDITLATNNQTEVTPYEKRSNLPKSYDIEEYFELSGESGLKYKRQSGIEKLDSVQARVTETSELSRSTAAVGFGKSAIATRSKKEVEERVADQMWNERNPVGMFYFSALVMYRVDAYFNRMRGANNKVSSISIAKYHVAMVAALIVEPELASIYKTDAINVGSSELNDIEVFNHPIEIPGIESQIDKAIEKAAETVYEYFEPKIVPGKPLFKDEARKTNVEEDLKAIALQL